MARSKAYPVIDLSEAVRALEAIEGDLGRGKHDRDSMARALGYSSGVGLAARKVAALVQYGLFRRAPAGHYEATELSRAVLHPRDKEDYAKAVRAAFESPALFSDLLERYRPQGRVPNQLANILIRDHGIMRDVADNAASVFLESARFAGVIDPDANVFIGPDVDEAREPDTVGNVEEDISSGGRTVTANKEGGQLGIPPGLRAYPLNLAGGEARLLVPTPLVRADIRKLRQGLELILSLLELDAAGDDSAA